MIKNQWYVVLRSSELKQGKPIGVTRMGEKMVFWRDSSGKPVCQVDFCPHRGVMLSLGALKGDNIQCPFHGFEYDSTGRCTLVPANGVAALVPQALKVVTYTAREAHGYIYIWWGEPRQTYPGLPWFDELDEGFSTAEFSDHWKVDYSRAIENQLDPFHLPYVHKTTIGRGNRTICNGPYTVTDEDSLQIWVFNQSDDGKSVARRASELSKPERPPFLVFQFPHLWMNRITDDIRLSVFFTPVDDENCILYVRSHQRFLKVPILRNLVTWFFNPANRVIVNQDKRVVLSQRPVKSGLRIGEKLIPADNPIIEYRSMREKLQKAAGQKTD